MSAKNKQEKTIIDAKIAKVREVVRNCSTNDIVLALHFFDLDVEKTIHAFLQGGSKEALGDWERTGGSASKKNKQKKNKLAGGGGGTSNKLAPSSTNVATKPVASNGYTSMYTPIPTSQLLNAGSGSQTVNANIEPTGSNSTFPSSHFDARFDKTIETAGGEKPMSTDSVQSSLMLNLEISRFLSLDDKSKKKAISEEFESLADYRNQLDTLKNEFNDEFSHLQSEVLRNIQEIRFFLANKERQLFLELTRCREDAFQMLLERRTKLQKLTQEMNDAKNGKERDDLFKEIKLFKSENVAHQQMARASRFVYNNTKVIDAIASFGEVIHIKDSNTESDLDVKHLQEKLQSKQQLQQNGTKLNNGISIKKKGSTTDLSNPHVTPSNLRELNQTSSEVIEKPEKNIAQLANNGIIMQSDGLSADQLADIQKKIEETLLSQGIDPSILTDIAVNTVAPRRRQPPNSNGGKSGGGDKSRKANGAGGNRSYNSNNTNGTLNQKSKVKL